MARVSGSFLGGFADAFIRTQAQQQQLQQNKQIKDAQLKKYKAELELQEQQANARKTLMSRIAPEMGPPQSITDLLASPEGAGMLLQSGALGAKDLLQEQRLSKGQNLLEQFLGGGPSGTNMENIDPISLAGAAQSSQLRDLRPRRFNTTTIDTPDGPKIIQYAEDDPTFQRMIGDAKAEKVTPEQAGRLSGLAQAQEIVGNFKQNYITPDGKVSLSQFDLFNMSADTPRTQGRLLRKQFEDAIDSVIRARTGAAANADEMKSMLGQFMPQVQDDEATIADKINRLEAFVSGSLDVATLPKSLRDKFKSQEEEDTTVIVDDEFLKRLEELRNK